jgi:hypothetical protein
MTITNALSSPHTFEFLPVGENGQPQSSLQRSENRTNLIFANSLLIRFSSNSLALAFRKSAINCTNPRIFELFPELPRPRKPAAAEDAILDFPGRPPTATDIYSLPLVCLSVPRIVLPKSKGRKSSMTPGDNV